MRKTVALRRLNLLVLLRRGLSSNPQAGTFLAQLQEIERMALKTFRLLKSHIDAAAAGIVVTPNALSEASNLLRYINEPAKTQNRD